MIFSTFRSLGFISTVLYISSAIATPIKESIRRSTTSTSFTASDLKLPFPATYADAITPFNLTLDEAFLNRTLLKVSLTNFVDDLPGQPEFTDGPPKRIVQGVADYWISNYSWRGFEAKLNEEFKQYTTVVSVPSEFNYSSPVPLHFVHHRSPRADAIPLLFIHGWPGSILEVEPIIDALTNPPNSSLPAFHVVAPSLPGYGFSPAPLQAGFGFKVAGAASNALMQKLGYSKYVVQGGDYGAAIEHIMAVNFPDAVVALHSYFWVLEPAPADMERYYAGAVTDQEKAYIELSKKFGQDLWSTFGTLSQLRPRKLSAALVDSPIGLAMWIFDLENQATWEPDKVWTPEVVINWTMMQWIPGVYATFAIAEYATQDRVLSGSGWDLLQYATQPSALSGFPKDIWYNLPLDWAKRRGNVKSYTIHERGGHFPTLDAPDLVISDARAFFGNGSLSGTEIFTRK